MEQQPDSKELLHHTSRAKAPKQSVYLKTFGCQMNEYDSQRIFSLLAAMDYEPTNDPRVADLILINTCSVREKSEQKFFSLLGRLKKLRKGGKVLLGVGGCVAQQEGEKILERAPFVDLVFGTSALARLPELIERARDTERAQIDTVLTDEAHPFEPVEASACAADVKAYVTIMRGCNNFCSFCVVPYVRGRERSRPMEEIVDEVRALVERGVKEVTLLGQNVNSYGPGLVGEHSHFPQLLQKIEGIEGLKRIRFTTSHPKDLSDSLIDCFAAPEKLCPHIHLPLQSGSNRVLEMMNRGYTREDYLKKIKRLRAIQPDIAITTDLIVGFPGEREDDFQETVSIIQEIEYDEFFSFKYSDRPMTRASQLDGKVSEQEKSRRLSLLQGVQKSITMKKNRALVGKTVHVLVEGESRRNCLRLTGRSGTNKVVHFEGPLNLKGEIVPVAVLAAHSHSLQGQLC